MRKINYQLIVSDFDGTLVNDDGTISERNKQAIADYIAAGGAFVISTGRMPDGILSRAKELGLKGLVSCGQGAIIADIESQKFVFERKIPYETTLAVVEELEKMNLHIHIYDEWSYYSNMDDEALKFYEKAVRSKAKLSLDKPLSQFIRENQFSSYKIVAMVLPEDNERVMQTLIDARIEGCSVTRSSEFMVEVLGTNCSKGTAVEFLAKHFGVELDKTIGIGDQLNDLPMIERAGLGIAVQNADIALKEKANIVTPMTNEDGAIAWTIEQFGFQK